MQKINDWIKKPVTIYVASLSLFIFCWWYASTRTIPTFIPSPAFTFQTLIELIETKVIFSAIGISFFRILTGWLIGGMAGIPIGILMGRIKTIRQFGTPYIEFFRFIPPIAFVTLFLIWFGSGERSKIMLIIYTTIFTVVLNVMAGSVSVREGVVGAARCLGASEFQLLFKVIIPSTVPYMITGLRIAMGNSFMTIVAAEMIAATSGIGFIIWTSRSYMLTEQIFVAIVVLGCMGFLTDRCLNLIMKKFFGKYMTD